MNLGWAGLGCVEDLDSRLWWPGVFLKVARFSHVGLWALRTDAPLRDIFLGRLFTLYIIR